MHCAALDEARVRLPPATVDPDHYAALATMVLKQDRLSAAERGRVIGAMIALADEVRALREEASRANARIAAVRASMCTPLAARARVPKRPRSPRHEVAPRRQPHRPTPARPARSPSRSPRRSPYQSPRRSPYQAPRRSPPRR